MAVSIYRHQAAKLIMSGRERESKQQQQPTNKHKTTPNNNNPQTTKKQQQQQQQQQKRQRVTVRQTGRPKKHKNTQTDRQTDSILTARGFIGTIRAVPFVITPLSYRDTLPSNRTCPPTLGARGHWKGKPGLRRNTQCIQIWSICVEAMLGDRNGVLG